MAGKRRLTFAQVRRARSSYAGGGISQIDLARRYGLSHAAMGNLLRGESYRDAGGPVGSLGQPRGRVDVAEARRLKAEGWTYRALGERYGVSHARVWSLLCKAAGGRV